MPTTRSVPPPCPLDQHRQARPFADCLAAGIDPARLGGRGIGIHRLRKTAINDAIRNGATMHVGQPYCLLRYSYSDFSLTRFADNASARVSSFHRPDLSQWPDSLVEAFD